MNQHVIDVASGKIKADLAVINGKIVNVCSKEVYDGGIAAAGGIIAAVGDIEYTIGPETKIIDAKGKYLTPGFIDGHIHPESTNLSMTAFAQGLLTHGTTVIMTDLHEAGVVNGLEAIEALLDEAAATDLKMYFVVPSHVPFAPNLETSGGVFDSSIISKALDRPDAVGISEIVAPYLLNGYPDLMEAMDVALKKGKSLQGHLPDISGKDLNTCLAAGVTTDHEALSTEEAVERVRSGCHLMMREGSAARNLKDLVKVITEYKMDSTLCNIITDDLHTIDLAEKGHLDESIRTALSLGVDFITAVQLVTINAARAFHLDHEIGSLAPGRRADINITDGPESFAVHSVISAGREVVREGTFLNPYPEIRHKPCLLNSVTMPKKITAEDLGIQAECETGNVKVQAMRTLDWIPITIGEEAVLPVRGGIVQCNPEADILHIAQVERYGKHGNIGKAFMAGFNLKGGALASSVAHDNHNIIAMGTNLDDVAFAMNRVAELQGGQVVVKDGQVLAEAAYPVLGLLSDLPLDELSNLKKKLIEETHKLGSTIPAPFMFLSFIGLAAIPEYAITDQGFVHVPTQSIINPILEVVA